MTRFCSECGIPLPEQASFCPSCGASALDQWLASQEAFPLPAFPSAPEREESVAEAWGEGERYEEPPGEEPGARVSVLSAEPPSGEAGVVEEKAEVAAGPAASLGEMLVAARFLFDGHRILWYGAEVALGWMLLALSHLFAYVADEGSATWAIGWRLGGWGVFLAMFALASATLAASLIADVGSQLRLPWKPPSGILRHASAIVGPAFFFLGIGVVGAMILVILGALARSGAVGRILWALLFVPQCVLALLVLAAGSAFLAALVYGPVLAVTDGGTFSQTLYRLRLLFTREGARTVGYLLLGLVASGVSGALVMGALGGVIRGIERVAAWASQGEVMPILAIGKDVISACVPWGSWLGLGVSPGGPSVWESDVRLAGFFWAISVVFLIGVGIAIPLFLMSGWGALATWMLLGRLVRQQGPDERC
jgi:hypothetical protein